MEKKAKTIGAAPDRLEAALFSTCPLNDGTVPRQYVQDYLHATLGKAPKNAAGADSAIQN